MAMKAAPVWMQKTSDALRGLKTRFALDELKGWISEAGKRYGQSYQNFRHDTIDNLLTDILIWVMKDHTGTKLNAFCECIRKNRQDVWSTIYEAGKH